MGIQLTKTAERLFDVKCTITVWASSEEEAIEKTLSELRTIRSSSSRINGVMSNEVHSAEEHIFEIDGIKYVASHSVAR